MNKEARPTSAASLYLKTLGLLVKHEAQSLKWSLAVQAATLFAKSNGLEATQAQETLLNATHPRLLGIQDLNDSLSRNDPEETQSALDNLDQIPLPSNVPSHLMELELFKETHKAQKPRIINLEKRARLTLINEISNSLFK